MHVDRLSTVCYTTGMEGIMNREDANGYMLTNDKGDAECQHPAAYRYVSPTMLACKLCGEVLKVAH